MFLIWQSFEDFWTKNISLSRRSFHQTKWDHLSSIKRYLLDSVSSQASFSFWHKLMIKMKIVKTLAL
jgi:hypothetical protein